MAKRPDRPPQETDQATPDAEQANIDPFYLEKIYPQASALLQSHTAVSTDKDSIIVSLDTSALLLPYQIKAGNITEVGRVFDELAKQKRLFVAGRVVREFTKRRDQQLAAIIADLNKRRSRLSGEMPPLLSSVTGHAAAKTSHDELTKAHDKYIKTLDELVAEIKRWRGNDPIATAYAKVFPADSIIDTTLTDEMKSELLADMEWRYRHSIPPGYKDASKEDGGIGDFLIWKSLLRLGTDKKMDLAFVTGEEKADWFVRADGGPVYPRPELVDEYRRASGGKSFRLMSLYQLLDEMKVPQDVVLEVKAAEAQANTVVAAQRTLPIIEHNDDDWSTGYLTPEAKTLLVEAAAAKSGRIIHTRFLSGEIIQTNGKNFGTENHRSLARWKHALGQLTQYNLLIKISREVYELTAAGYQAADRWMGDGGPIERMPE